MKQSKDNQGQQENKTNTKVQSNSVRGERGKLERYVDPWSSIDNEMFR